MVVVGLVAVVQFEVGKRLQYIGGEEKRVVLHHGPHHGDGGGEELPVGGELQGDVLRRDKGVHTTVVRFGEEIGDVFQNKRHYRGDLLVINLVAKLFDEACGVSFRQLVGHLVSHRREQIHIGLRRSVRHGDADNQLVVAAKMLVCLVDALVFAAVGQETADVFHQMQSGSTEDRQSYCHEQDCPKHYRFCFKESVCFDEKRFHCSLAVKSGKDTKIFLRNMEG